MHLPFAQIFKPITDFSGLMLGGTSASNYTLAGASGTVTVYATTSTVSGGGDQGADPNKVVAITDTLGATSGAGERFTTIRPATDGVRYGGVAVLPRGF